ncbi:MAG: redoxin domain-containing protein [Fimbriiglobus sp.]
MRVWFFLLLCCLMPLTTGCRLFERDRDRNRPLPGENSPVNGKTRPNDNWIDGPVSGVSNPKPKFPKDTLPLDPRPGPAPAPNFDTTRASSNSLGGVVLMPDGAAAGTILVEYASADGSDGPGAPVEVMTDDKGRFLIQGLKAKTSYILTARARQEGRQISGRKYASTGTPGSTQLEITLVDGLSFPKLTPNFGGSDLPDRPKPVIPGPRPFDPPDTSIPSMAPGLPSGLRSDLPMPRGSTEIPREEWSPTVSPGGPITPTIVPPESGRGDLRTSGPTSPFKPPVGNIRGAPTGVRSSPLKRSSPFVLLDLTEVEREFPTGRKTELLLLEFLKTNCVPCKKAIPVLKSLQDQYSEKGLEVVGIVCDDLPQKARLQAALDYSRSHQLNYRLAIEPAAKPGALLERFDVASYPGLVLINGEGQILWQGHPSERATLEAILRQETRR